MSYRGRYAGRIYFKDINYKNAMAIGPDQNIQEKYDLLAGSAQDGKMGALSATNPRVLLLGPGNWSAREINSTDNYGLSLNQYVHIVGSGPGVTILEPDSTFTAGVQIASDPTANDTGITNMVANLTIKATYCAGANRILGDDNDYIRTMLLVNCELHANAGDCIFISTSSKDDYVNVHAYNCRLFSSFDGVVVQQANSTARLFGGEVICNCDANHGASPNTANAGRCLAPVVSGSIVEAYGTRLYCTSDQSAGTDQSAAAHAILSTAGTCRAFNCSMETNAVESGSGTAVGDAVKTASSGVVDIIGGKIINVVGTDSSYDLNNASGTVNVLGLDHNSANNSGIITYKDSSYLLYANTSAGAELVDTADTFVDFPHSATVPGAQLAAGDVVRISGQVLFADVNIGDTMDLKVLLGTEAILQTGDITPVANDDTITFDLQVTVNTAGASGKLMITGHWWVDLSGTVAGYIVSPTGAAKEVSEDISGNLTCKCQGDYSAVHEDNEAYLIDFKVRVEKERTS